MTKYCHYVSFISLCRSLQFRRHLTQPFERANPNTAHSCFIFPREERENCWHYTKASVFWFPSIFSSMCSVAFQNYQTHPTNLNLFSFPFSFVFSGGGCIFLSTLNRGWKAICSPNKLASAAHVLLTVFLVSSEAT